VRAMQGRRCEEENAPGVVMLEALTDLRGKGIVDVVRQRVHLRRPWWVVRIGVRHADALGLDHWCPHGDRGDRPLGRGKGGCHGSAHGLVVHWLRRRLRKVGRVGWSKPRLLVLMLGLGRRWLVMLELVLVLVLDVLRLLLLLRRRRRRLVWVLLELVLMVLLRKRLLLEVMMLLRLVGNSLEGRLGLVRHRMLRLVRDRHGRLVDGGRHAGPRSGGWEVRRGHVVELAWRGRRARAGEGHGSSPDREFARRRQHRRPPSGIGG
jgi:hypothetical protein